MKPRLVIFLAAVLVVSRIQAQNAPSVQQEIVVTASALPETVEDTPAAVSVITREDIESRQARDVSDILREVPGLTIARIGSSGHQTSLFTRGASSGHTLVLWNGIELNNPFFGGYDFGQFSTAGVEQVEVVRGPYSALYGSDSAAGVVNILTEPTSTHLRGSVEAGGNGLRNALVDAAHVTAATTISAALESRHDDGFAANDGFGEKSANVALRWKAAPSFSIGLTGRYMSYDLGIPTNYNSTGDALVPSLNRKQSGDDRQLALPIEGKLAATSYELTLAESRRSDDLRDPDDPFGLTRETTEARTRRARLTTRTATLAGTLIAGAEYERATVDDVTNFGPNFTGRRREERSLFVENRYSRAIGAARLELSAGVRRDRYETFGSETSPRLAAAWIAGSNKYRAAYGEAFRAPSIGEMFSPFGGNPDLRPERSRSVEAGYDRFFGTGIASVTLFQEQYRDLITNAGFVLANVGRARSRGVELSAKTPVTRGLSAAVSYTYLDAKQLSDDGGDQQLLRRPRHSGSLFLSYSRGTVDWSLTILRTGGRADILPVFPFSRTMNRAWTTVDTTVQVHMGRVTPFVKLENMTNARYEEVLGYPSPTRRASVGVRFGL